jgi:penicillin-binding protein 2
MGRLAQVQLIGAPGYRDIATGNRVRVIETPAPRGRILDAGGRVLAGSRLSYSVTLDWEGLAGHDADQRQAVFVDVATTLTDAGYPIERADVEAAFDRARRQALEPISLVDDVEPDLWIVLTERNLAGIAVEQRPLRIYPYGTSAAHLIGHLGVVQDQPEADELNAAVANARYRPGDVIGRAGLERVFERDLRGRPEIRRVEVDSRNRVVRTVEVVQEASPGHDLHLTVDIDLQRAAEQALAEQMATTAQTAETPAVAGGFVALDPMTGAVAALVSLPTFDPSAFVAGAGDTTEADAVLQADRRPLLNRVTNGLYAPGSTFKPVPAYAALTSGARGEYELWNDQGVYRLANCRAVEGSRGCQFQNAKGIVMGQVDVRAALTRSSDTYFYSLGERFWTDRDRYGDDVMQGHARRFGLGQPTGIELPGEDDGRVPTPAGRQSLHDQFPDAYPDPRWYTGDNVNLAIGQGDMAVTPLQLANLYATLAADGVRYQPRLVDRLTDQTTGANVRTLSPRLVASSPLDPVAATAIIDGLRAVPETGTAAAAFRDFPLDRFPVVAKTGTAEADGQADNALFAGYGPADDPRFAFAVVIEQGGFGGVAAAPVARRFLDWVVDSPPPDDPVSSVSSLAGASADTLIVDVSGGGR